MRAGICQHHAANAAVMGALANARGNSSLCIFAQQNRLACASIAFARTSRHFAAALFMINSLNDKKPDFMSSSSDSADKLAWVHAARFEHAVDIQETKQDVLDMRHVANLNQEPHARDTVAADRRR